jgi:hypothetical protein
MDKGRAKVFHPGQAHSEDRPSRLVGVLPDQTAHSLDGGDGLVFGLVGPGGVQTGGVSQLRRLRGVSGLSFV